MKLSDMDFKSQCLRSEAEAEGSPSQGMPEHRELLSQSKQHSAKQNYKETNPLVSIKISWLPTTLFETPSFPGSESETHQNIKND